MSTTSEMNDLSDWGLSNLFDGLDLSPPAEQATAAAVAEPAPATVNDAGPSRERGGVRLDGILFFDIETVPALARLESLGIHPPSATLPPETPIENLLSPEEFTSQDVAPAKQMMAGKRVPDEWIAACRAAERAGKKPRKGMFELLDDLAAIKSNAEAAVEAWRKQMALCPETLEIVSISLAIGSEEPRVMVRGDNEDPLHVDDEGSLLDWFWSEISKATRLCGFNILNFDLPAIFARSAAHGIRPSRKIGLRPGTLEVCDLMRARYPVGPARGLKEVARLCGLAEGVPDVDGSDVFRLWHEEPAKLAEYNASDVRLCQRLFKHWAGFFC